MVVAHPLIRGEAHLVGSSFLLLDSLLVDAHHRVGRGGRVAIVVGCGFAGVLLGLVLGRGTGGDGREEGRGKHALKRGEHLGRGRTANVQTGRAGDGEWTDRHVIYPTLGTVVSRLRKPAHPI